MMNQNKKEQFGKQTPLTPGVASYSRPPIRQSLPPHGNSGYIEVPPGVPLQVHERAFQSRTMQCGETLNKSQIRLEQIALSPYPKQSSNEKIFVQPGGESAARYENNAHAPIDRKMGPRLYEDATRDVIPFRGGETRACMSSRTFDSTNHPEVSKYPATAPQGERQRGRTSPSSDGTFGKRDELQQRRPPKKGLLRALSDISFGSKNSPAASKRRELLHQSQALSEHKLVSRDELFVSFHRSTLSSFYPHVQTVEQVKASRRSRVDDNVNAADLRYSSGRSSRVDFSRSRAYSNAA